ncbi:MAG: flagellar assembly protein FliW [Sulfuricurvum sp.]|jgi:flagellar assembly factor FliW|uniref:flagellar assembly protein FliW n=1 Tax=Sulfuricurvum sp. TaxID=2025608 RepID=UPI00263361E1|nr:flagellar assembly protein FliW [Sulfuricurvum sp.]MDD2838631.1 flagellar assembly protein FliW [Sulfuricurvum sp.]MDD3598248.1 flagellar assembly protein FliW [Sulfuricurvum sp.]MDD4885100.1 flagellar assembly protein FliW [Sulfuricurvum sp.]
MQYEVKSMILGFEQVDRVELKEVDELFSTLKSVRGGDVSFTLVNPYLLREYSFDLPTAIRVLLDINEKSNVLVYNVAVIQDPLDETYINFTAPLIFNQDNATMAQAVLDVQYHPDFGLAEPIKKFKARSAS